MITLLTYFGTLMTWSDIGPSRLPTNSKLPVLFRLFSLRFRSKQVRPFV